MKIAILADEAGKKEWVARGFRDDAEIIWLPERSVVPGAVAYIDLLFNNTREDKSNFEWPPEEDVLVLVNDVLKTNEQLPQNFIRFNGWSTFSGSSITEAAAATDSWKNKTEVVLAACNSKVEWVADIPGFITARVVSMIINEAWYALQENVSSEAETDTAMKLGTNYPYGPFEWGQKIGLLHIYRLLNKLSAHNARYTPCSLLKKQAMGE